MKLDKRIEEAVPAGQQLQELGMKMRDDGSSDQVSILARMIARSTGNELNLIQSSSPSCRMISTTTTTTDFSWIGRPTRQPRKTTTWTISSLTTISMEHWRAMASESFTLG